MMILITHAYGPQNRGDHELLKNLIEVLKVKYGNETDISVLSTFPKQSQLHFESIKFYKSPFYRPNGTFDWVVSIWNSMIWLLLPYIPFLNVALNPHRKRVYQLFQEAKYIYMCPGGYMYSNGSSYYTNLLNGYLFKSLKAKVIASPMSIGPFFSDFDKKLAYRFYKHVDTIHTRESYSFNLMKTLGFTPIFTHDLAWLEDAQVIDDYTWKDSYVGTVIDWNYPDGVVGVDYRARYIEEYIKAAEVLCKNTDAPLILYNQVGDGTGKSQDEILISEIVSKSNGTIVFDPSAHTPTVLKSRIKCSKGVLASRFHSALFAIQVEAPFVSISYQPKAEFILKDLELSDLSRSIIHFSGVEIAQKLINITDNYDIFKKRLILSKMNTKNNIVESFIKSN